MNKCPFFPVKYVETTTGGSDPEYSKMVFINSLDKIVTQAGRVSGPAPVMDKCLSFPVKFIESTAECSYPEHTGTIFIQ